MDGRWYACAVKRDPRVLRASPIAIGSDVCSEQQTTSHRPVKLLSSPQIPTLESYRALGVHKCQLADVCIVVVVVHII